MSTTPAGRPPAPGFSAELAVKWARQNLFSSRTNTALTVLIGLFLVWLFSIIFPIVAALKANNGEDYAYPFTWRLIT